MKKVIFILVLFFTSFQAYSQNVVKDKDGNFTATKSDTTKTSAKATGKTYTDSKGVKFPVMMSKNGLLFVIKTSKKTGNKYNFYLKD